MKRFMVITVKKGTKNGTQKAEFFNMYDSARAYALAMGAIHEIQRVILYKFYEDTKIYEILEDVK